MPRFIAFLRAINVGGHIVKMDELRSQFESLGFKNVETFIASGNVIFETKSTDVKALERKIETQLQKSLGYEVATFIRTDTELAAIAEYQAFPEIRIKSAGAFCIGFMAQALGEDARKAVLALRTEIDDFHINDREIYWLSTGRQSESVFSLVVLEKLLKTKGTFRGAKTVLRLTAKYPATER